MALIKCKECGAAISSKAKSCPVCGAAPAKKTSILTWIVCGLLALAILPSVFNSQSKDVSHPTPAPTAATPSKADIEINTVLRGAQLLKDRMKKPETFELISAGMIDGKTICYEYKARNSFNDRTTGRYVVTDTVSSEKIEDWNRLCAGKSATDYTSVRAVLK